MGKQPGGPGSPSMDKQNVRDQSKQEQNHTPIRGSDSSMQCGSTSMGKGPGRTSPTTAARTAIQADEPPPAAVASIQSWERASNVLREAVVDPGSQAAVLVPLRPSLRRIKDDLVRVLNEAVSSHNGNASLLVLGPPGTGKTLVVERALREVCAKHNGSDGTGAGSAAAAVATTTTTTTNPPPAATAVHNVGLVRLNGLLQPDERTAFQEVARQLCRDFGQKFVKSATFDENLVFLKGMLHALYKCLKKVIFLVDEFQQYAKKGKQQMLYYLLDMLQDSKIQAAVIGISSAHNVAEDLEKRVLSRVGRRRVLVTFPAAAQDGGGPGGGGGPGSIASPGGASAVRSPGDGGSGGGGTGLDGGADSYDGLMYDMLALHPGLAGLAGLGELEVAAHNGAVTEALRDVRVAECLNKLALIGAPPQHLSLVAEAALASWGDDLRRQGAAAVATAATRRRLPPPVLGVSHLLAALGGVVDAPERALVEAVSGLPVLSLVLLVAAHRLQRKGQPLCNFEMVWDEYRSIQGQRGAIAFSKQAAAAAWQALPLSGLAHYTDGNVESRGRDLSYAGVALLIGETDLGQGIREHPHCPDAVTRFHLQEI